MRNEPNMRLDQYRVRAAGIPDSPPGKNYGIFQIGVLRVISSGDDVNNGGWEHVSVSTRIRCLKWDEMEKVKQLFWGDQETVLQFHPIKSAYVNRHPHCLHLWRQNGIDHPLPPEQFI